MTIFGYIFGIYAGPNAINIASRCLLLPFYPIELVVILSKSSPISRRIVPSPLLVFLLSRCPSRYTKIQWEGVRQKYWIDSETWGAGNVQELQERRVEGVCFTDDI